jgi:MarR family transcriptional regulator, transcriptional regulator for hemolysin
MPRPAVTPIGLELATTAKHVSSAFDAALAEAGGSRPSWLILLAIKTRSFANQQEIADAVGIRGATLTYHLNAMEADGLLIRRRDHSNRRIHVVELTEAGHRAFDSMRGAAIEFDRRLRKGLTDAQLTALRDALRWMSANVGAVEP